MDHLQNTEPSRPVFDRFISPLRAFMESAKRKYKCHAVSDLQWIEMGIERVLGDHRSGCAFVQDRVMRDLLNLKKSNYFESCKSDRRLAHLGSITEEFIAAHARTALKKNDLFGQDDALNKPLEKLHIYAGDGHFHSASSHDKRDAKKTKHAIGHLYALNLRNQFLSHLALGSDGTKKKPHDMGVLKKLDIVTLRQGAAKGQKVLYIWDRAGIDFAQWYRWKNTSGIYFLSRVKENMVLEHPLPNSYDKSDPVNEGILGDDMVSHSGGTMIRRVRFIIPETGEVMEFLTNLGTNISPGMVAQLYFMRWRIEKSFDELKNKLYETKAWAMSTTAKKTQAAFIVLTYNLSQLLSRQIEAEPSDQDEETKPKNRINEKKKAQRLEACETELKKNNRAMPYLRLIYQKPSQLSVKFYRWLRAHLHSPSPWNTAQKRLCTLYDQF